MLFAAPAFLAEAMELIDAQPPAARRTCLVAEVTERCDVGCATCSASSTMVGDEQDAPDLVVSILRQAAAIGADVVALSGGEPLMRSDLWDIVDALHRTISKIVIITSGRGFETNPAILAGIAARAQWLEIYLQFDSLRDEILVALRTPDMTAKIRRERLKLAIDTGAATTAVCVIPQDSTEQAVGELALFCRDGGAAGVSFQPLRRLGRHPSSSAVAGPISTIDHIQGSALKALGVADARPRPFAQQPLDMSVAFVRGAEAEVRDRFFTECRQRDVFRVATSSYWDFTNYFAPFAGSGLYYFHVGAGQPLNGRYFDAVLSERAPSTPIGGLPLDAQALSRNPAP
jgi:organic radical activating enzyme